MSVQTTYPDNIPAAYEGMRATEIAATILSRDVEDTSGIGFGVAVTQGTNDKGITAFAGSGDVLGITVRDRSVDANNPDEFAQYESARVMTIGDIWVMTAAAVSAGDDVYVTSAGAFTSEASGNTQFAGARFDTSTTEADLAVVRIS